MNLKQYGQAKSNSVRNLEAPRVKYSFQKKGATATEMPPLEHSKRARRNWSKDKTLVQPLTRPSTWGLGDGPAWAPLLCTLVLFMQGGVGSAK